MTGYLAYRARRLALLSLVALLAACSLVPQSGPTKENIFAGSVLREGDAYIVGVDRRISSATRVAPALGFSDGLRNAGLLGGDTIRPGDVITLNVFENVTEGLLAGPETSNAILTEVQVDDAGFIFVPYAGRVRAAGLSPDALRRRLTESLDEQTPDPQVMVSREQGDGATVALVGSLTAQGVYPIERSTRTLTAMIARAGGVSIPVETAQVKVSRGNWQDTVWLEDLFRHPGLDIALRGGDRILVQPDQRAFTILGATGGSDRVRFDTPTISAIEAIARVGGLDPARADPTGVFVFRDEPGYIANKVLARNDLRGDQRFVYVLDLTQPTGMFNARDFRVRDGDTIYVTEAPLVAWGRIIAALTGSLATVTQAQDIASGSTD